MKNTSHFITILTETMDKISKAHDNNEINIITEGLLTNFTQSEYADFLLFNQEKRVLFNDRNKDRVEIEVASPKGLLGNSFLTKKPSIYNHVTSEKNYFQEIDNPKKMRLKSQLIYPLIDDENIVAIIRVTKTIKTNINYTNNDIALLKSIESFLLKLIKILNSENKDKSIDVDKEEIGAKINEVEENRKGDNSQLNSTMLFLSNTVHDIRTPANSLYGFLDLLEEQIKDPQLLDFIANAKESAQFINNLTDSILERVKHENEVKTSEPTVINSVKFFANIGNIFTANMHKKEIHYLIYIDPLIPKELKLETLKLKRVLINLIGNAYKFTPKDEIIEFRIEYKKDKKIYISIRDTGLGIAKERQDKIFEAFEQAKADTSVHFGGTGLGLAICAKYVLDLDGKLELISEIDQGSNFYFEIPVEVVDATPAHQSFEDKSKQILILTDNPSCIDANNIKQYLIDLAIDEDNISIASEIKEGTTHLFCFQHKLNDDLIATCKDKNNKLVIVEEELFSLRKDEKYNELPIISENSYYGDTLFSIVSSKRKPKVLIADDNKINIMLLKSILESEYCELHHSMNGQETLDTLKNAVSEKKPFDIIFLDKHMPTLSGSEVIRSYRKIEKISNIKTIKAISITGDPTLDKEEEKLYDLVLAKPFNKNEIKNAFKELSK